jgi:hypothetical protein
MPSSLHEVLVEMFCARPALATELLAGPLAVTLPDHDTTRVEPATFTDLPSIEYRADTVVVLASGQVPVLAVIVEVQLNRDAEKRWTWPIYLAGVRRRLRCPAVLLVVCLDPAVARWCATPIALGPGATVTPLVLGPQLVPVVTEPADAARAPELAVLSAIAHGGDPARGGRVLDALLGAFGAIDPDRAALYCDVVLAALPAAASRYLEALVTATYEYQSEFARRYVAEGEAVGRAEGQTVGRAEGEARAVLAVLEARGIGVTDEVRARITGCRDLDQLDGWVRRAVTVDSAHDLFA